MYKRKLQRISLQPWNKQKKKKEKIGTNHKKLRIRFYQCFLHLQTEKHQWQNTYTTTKKQNIPSHKQFTSKIYEEPLQFSYNNTNNPIKIKQNIGTATSQRKIYCGKWAHEKVSLNDQVNANWNLNKILFYTHQNDSIINIVILKVRENTKQWEPSYISGRSLNGTFLEFLIKLKTWNPALTIYPIKGHICPQKYFYKNI